MSNSALGSQGKGQFSYADLIEELHNESRTYGVAVWAITEGQVGERLLGFISHVSGSYDRPAINIAIRSDAEFAGKFNRLKVVGDRVETRSWSAAFMN